eukprot:3941284-Rhodomonas_salina.10
MEEGRGKGYEGSGGFTLCFQVLKAWPGSKHDQKRVWMMMQLRGLSKTMSLLDELNRSQASTHEVFHMTKANVVGPGTHSNVPAFLAGYTNKDLPEFVTSGCALGCVCCRSISRRRHCGEGLDPELGREKRYVAAAASISAQFRNLSSNSKQPTLMK